MEGMTFEVSNHETSALIQAYFTKHHGHPILESEINQTCSTWKQGHHQIAQLCVTHRGDQPSTLTILKLETIMIMNQVFNFWILGTKRIQSRLPPILDNTGEGLKPCSGIMTQADSSVKSEG